MLPGIQEKRQRGAWTHFAKAMEKHLSATACVITLITALIGGTIAVESRYAKAKEVQQQMDSLWAKQLKLRILELQLQPSPLNNNDKALLDYLQQELREATE